MAYRNTLLALLVGILLAATTSAQQRYTVSGTVMEAGSRETLIGATVTVPGKAVGVATNGYGFYTLALPAADSVVLEFSYVGYATQRHTVALRGNVVLNVELEIDMMQIDEIEVVAESKTSSRSTQTSVVELPIKQLKAIPMLLGEKDLLRAFQLMPGVQSGGEGTSGLYVRGGGPDQNLIILDDAPVYNAFHLFGFMSLFNGDAIKNVELIKGGFPARYGGRLSSVMDIAMRDGRKDSIGGEAGIGLLSSRLMVEGPIVKDKVSFIVSGRRSYIDLLMRPAMKLVEETTVGYYFYDLTAKLNWEIDKRNKLYVSGYFGRDKFYMTDEYGSTTTSLGLFWDNATATVRWNRIMSERMFANLSAIFSNYRFDIFFDEKMPGSNYRIDYMSGIRDYGLKYDLTWSPLTGHTLRMGALATLHEFRPQVLRNIDTESGLDSRNEQIYRTLESALYAEDEMRLGDIGLVNAGLRLSLHSVGLKHLQMHVEPRASVSMFINDRSSVKASFATMNQYIHLLSNTGVGMPTDLWVPATENLPAQRSWQAAMGYTYDLKPWHTTLSVEGYYKRSKRIITYLPGASFMNVDEAIDGNMSSNSSMDWESNVTTGSGDAYGVEMLAHRKSGRLAGWVGYTLSWNRHTFAEINNGKPFYPKYDRRHDVSIVATFEATKRLTFTATWVYGTGNAMSIARAKYPTLYEGDGFEYVYYYGERNSFRMAPYHRLDLGLQWRKYKRKTMRTWEFGVYNAYNRRNPYFYTQRRDRQVAGSEVIKLMQVSIFPFLPSVSWSIKF